MLQEGGEKVVDRKLLGLSAKLFCRAVNEAVVSRSLRDLPKRDQLTQVQLACVRFVHLHPDSSVGEIAAGLMISNAAAAKLIDRLVKRHFLVREEDVQDRRVLKIKLTAEGQKVLEEATLLEQRYFNEIVDRMAPGMAENLQLSLKAFLKAAFQDPETVDVICLWCGREHLDECVGNTRYRELTGKNRSKI